MMLFLYNEDINILRIGLRNVIDDFHKWRPNAFTDAEVSHIMAILLMLEVPDPKVPSYYNIELYQAVRSAIGCTIIKP